MLEPEQLEEIQRRAVLGDHRAAWYLSDRAEIAGELERIRDGVDIIMQFETRKALTALIERIK